MGFRRMNPVAIAMRMQQKKNKEDAKSARAKHPNINKHSLSHEDLRKLGVTEEVVNEVLHPIGSKVKVHNPNRAAHGMVGTVVSRNLNNHEHEVRFNKTPATQNKKTFTFDGMDLHRLNEEVVTETLSKSAPVSSWIHDFVHSKNSKFEGKSRKERIRMAIGAFYGKQNEERALDEARINKARQLNIVFHSHPDTADEYAESVAKRYGATHSENLGGDRESEEWNHTFPSHQHARKFAKAVRKLGGESFYNTHPKAAEGRWHPGKLKEIK